MLCNILLKYDGNSYCADQIHHHTDLTLDPLTFLVFEPPKKKRKKMQMTHVFVALYITTLCMFANAATMNVTFENQNITVRDVESKGSKTRMSERWGHVEIIGAGKVVFSRLFLLLSRF